MVPHVCVCECLLCGSSTVKFGLLQAINSILMSTINHNLLLSFCQWIQVEVQFEVVVEAGLAHLVQINIPAISIIAPLHLRTLYREWARGVERGRRHSSQSVMHLILRFPSIFTHAKLPACKWASREGKRGQRERSRKREIKRERWRELKVAGYINNM